MKKQIGVTLLELMIVVAIVGIISAVAYPSYQEFVRDSRRADAQGALMSFAGAMERYFTVNNTYCGAGPGDIDSCSSGDPDAAVFWSSWPKDGSDTYYNLDIASVAATSFTVRAQPTGAQTGDTCGTLMVDHTGSRSASTTGCWP